MAKVDSVEVLVLRRMARMARREGIELLLDSVGVLEVGRLEFHSVRASVEHGSRIYCAGMQYMES